ncbi:MAG: serine/threonine protein kinase [Gemmataceae bacterium]|nr:serine/threonine protein kinase [Gemmataceae bacterium]
MADADTFLRKVLRSGLLDREQLRLTLRALPKEKHGDVAAIGDCLMQAGKLTRFQLHMLGQGITVGLQLGPYQLLTPLGRGGMGTVYLALDPRVNQHIALKILPPKLAKAEQRLLARFQREMELSRKVNDPHLARTLDAGVNQNIHYIAMEYIPGRTLYRLVTSQGALSVGRTAHLFSEIATGLSHAHALGLIHRDMKPSNIMVTPHGHAKVLDLGLAVTEGEEVDDIEVVGGKGYIVGSIDYMAPEQTRDPMGVDARADLYALGCCIYFALTGRPPFPEGKIFAKVRAHRHEEPLPLASLNKEVPAAFAQIVHKLLAKTPTERYASATELAAALTPFAASPLQALDQPSDADYQQAIRTSIDTWTPPAPSAKPSQEDAVLFGIATEDRMPTTELMSHSLMGNIEKIQPRVWIAVGIGVVVLVTVALCTITACVVSMGR